jgi:acetyl-CoA C-acetyltransferase
MNTLRSRLQASIVIRRFSSFKDHDVVVASFARTPIGKLGGALASLNAPALGAHAIQAAVARSGLDKKDIEEAFLGNVVSAGVGQAPTRQAVIYAGLSLDCPSTSINKVCASGMKAAMLAALSVASGYRNCVVAGGKEFAQCFWI